MSEDTGRSLTFGEKAVGLPSGDPSVQRCKKMFANVIDQMNVLRDRLLTQPGTSEAIRLTSIAITEAQTAQMWAVKALTWRS